MSGVSSPLLSLPASPPPSAVETQQSPAARQILASATGQTASAAGSQLPSRLAPPSQGEGTLPSRPSVAVRQPHAAASPAGNLAGAANSVDRPTVPLAQPPSSLETSVSQSGVSFGAPAPLLALHCTDSHGLDSVTHARRELDTAQRALRFGGSVARETHAAAAQSLRAAIRSQLVWTRSTPTVSSLSHGASAPIGDSRTVPDPESNILPPSASASLSGRADRRAASASALTPGTVGGRAVRVSASQVSSIAISRAASPVSARCYGRQSNSTHGRLPPDVPASASGSQLRWARERPASLLPAAQARASQASPPREGGVHDAAVSLPPAPALSPLPIPPSDTDSREAVSRALHVVAELRQTLEALQSRGAVAVPDIAAAVCAATQRATAPLGPRPPPRGCADDAASVMLGSPFEQCPPGPWAAPGRRPGDPHAGPCCSCGAVRCSGRGHFPVVDVFELYDLHCQHVCDAHAIDPTSGVFLYPAAHAQCPIHTKLSLLSGAWVPFKSDAAIPQEQLRARRIVVDGASEDGAYISDQIARGIELDLWEELSDADAADPAQCTIVEAAFAALVGKLALSAEEAAVVDDGSPHVDVPAIEALAEARAQAFIAELKALPGQAVDKATFAAKWAALGGQTKRRLCVAHNRFLNECSRGWSVSFTSPHAILETALEGDIFIVRDHKGGYNVIPIRPDQRRFFCFWHPVTGKILRAKRLDFGWALSPGIFCAFTAELNAIISSRLAAEVHPRSLSRYYVDDCNARVPRGGGAPSPAPANSPASRLFARASSANESNAIAVLVDTQERVGVPMAFDKDNIGEAVPYLGVVINSANRSALVLPSKIFKTLTMMHVLLRVSASEAAAAHSIAVPRSFALKAAGSGQWLAQNFRQGRLHTAALWLSAELLRKRSPPPLSRCPGLEEALLWWVTEAAAGRLQPHRFVKGLDIPLLSLGFVGSASLVADPGVVFSLPRPVAHDGAARQVVALLHDASGELTAGAVGGCWRAEGDQTAQAFYYQLSEEERAWSSIAPKELRALVEWIERFGSRYIGAVLLAGTDNAGNVFTVNRLRVDPSDTVMAGLLSRLLAAADRWGIDVIVWWCPRALNGVSDALSKSPSLTDARRVAISLGLTLSDPCPDVAAVGTVGASTVPF